MVLSQACGEAGPIELERVPTQVKATAFFAQAVFFAPIGPTLSGIVAQVTRAFEEM